MEDCKDAIVGQQEIRVQKDQGHPNATGHIRGTAIRPPLSTSGRLQGGSCGKSAEKSHHPNATVAHKGECFELCMLLNMEGANELSPEQSLKKRRVEIGVKLEGSWGQSPVA